jgi:hypothetical protein
LILPEGDAPAHLINRWNTVVSSSPVTVKIFENNSNMAIGSTWDEESQELTLPEGILSDQSFPAGKWFAFLIDNIVTTTIRRGNTLSSTNLRLMAAFADPVTVIGLEEDDLVDIGYTYNGLTFSKPESI